jgi:hypothetical protein
MRLFILVLLFMGYATISLPAPFGNDVIFVGFNVDAAPKVYRLASTCCRASID